jgi:hypothetical protein
LETGFEGLSTHGGIYAHAQRLREHAIADAVRQTSDIDSGPANAKSASVFFTQTIAKSQKSS